MTAWRNILVSGFIGASLLAGCTVTTSSGNNDGGWQEETGGVTSTGGSANAGGSANTGGTTGAGTTVVVVQCTPNYVAPAIPRCGDNTPTTTCDSCLQTHECGDAYKACYQTPCMDLISNVQQCMAKAFDDSTTGVLPPDAETTCLKTYGLDNPTTVDAVNAKELWKVITASIFCNEVCCEVITSH